MLILLLIFPALTAFAMAQQPVADSGGQIDFQTDILPLLSRFCSDCHSGDSPNAGIDFDQLDIAKSATTDRNVWKKTHVQLSNHIMPPPDAELPSDSERKLIEDWIQSQALAVPCDGPRFAGRVTLRRLNRDEYNRTIRDLIGVDFRPADDFPSDDVGYGFDNIGDVLNVPPVLLERYMNAADEIARRAIVVAEPDFAPKQQMSGAVLATTGEVAREIDVKWTSNYIVRINAWGQQAGSELVRMKLKIDDQTIQEFSVEATQNEPGQYEAEVRLEQGKRTIAAAFLNDYYEPNHPDPNRRDRNLHVDLIELVGPIGVLPDELLESHRRLLPNTPPPQADRENQLSAARENLNRFIPRALRRRTNRDELERYVGIAAMVLDDGASFERAMQVAVQAVLVSPHFLFRVEQGPKPDGPEQKELSDFELATRISYFLWSSTPDDPLLVSASKSELKQPDVWRKHVRRMLDHPRSDALVKNFAGQWLQLRKLDTISVDTGRFPEFTPQLRAAMRRETELLVESVIREDRSIFDLLTANYTHVNETLAALYGIPQIAGEEFRRVPLRDTRRRGLLGQASMLTVTSNPTRTSPVKRGKWILDNLLAAPPPPSPPNVPSLDGAAEETKTASLKERMELHRASPACAGCHQIMDPLGFGLENFDAIGRWRESEDGVKIDARGKLPDGRSFDGPVQLRNTLLARKAEFRRCLASKLLTYSLGRGLEYFDECTLDEICTQVEASDDRFSALVEAILDSHPFRFQSRTPLP